MESRKRTAKKRAKKTPQSTDRGAAIRAQSSVARSKLEASKKSETFSIGKARRDRKGISIYMNPLAKDILDEISGEQGKTIQDLGLEALNLIFVKYGHKPVA